MQTFISKVIRSCLAVIVAVIFFLHSANIIFAQESFIAYAAAGANAAAIQFVVDAFRNAVGSPNNLNNPGPIFSGRREINWDGGGQFSDIAGGKPVRRIPKPWRALHHTGNRIRPGSAFRASNDIQQCHLWHLHNVQSLAVVLGGGQQSDGNLFQPGTDVPAMVNAFGAVFSDVDLPKSTFMEYFGPQAESSLT